MLNPINSVSQNFLIRESLIQSSNSNKGLNLSRAIPNLHVQNDSSLEGGRAHQQNANTSIRSAIQILLVSLNDAEKLGEQLYNAARFNESAKVSKIVKLEEFKNIPITYIDISISTAVENSYSEIAKTLINTSRFIEISVDSCQAYLTLCMDILFRNPDSEDQWKIVNDLLTALTKSGKILVMDQDNLDWLLIHAAEKYQKPVVGCLLNEKVLPLISALTLSNIVYENIPGVKNDTWYYDVIIKCLDSSQFKTLKEGDLLSLLNRATDTYKHYNIMDKPESKEIIAKLNDLLGK